MTGARGGEILAAPSELIMIGKVPCIDLRKAGLNRVVHEVFPQEKALLGYSFRHHFQQMLSASGIGLELSNKVFGHRGGETYERYGQGLSVSEAQTFREKVHFPFSLKALLATGISS